MFGRKAIGISAKTRADAAAKDNDPALGDDKDKDKSLNDSGGAPSKDMDAALIVFGRDDKGKAHASRYSEADRIAAMKAAHLMGFKALAVTKDAIRHIADELPQGRLFDSGKAFVPFVKEGRCLALEAHAKQFPDDVLILSSEQIAELEAEDAAHKDNANEETGGAKEKVKSTIGNENEVVAAADQNTDHYRMVEDELASIDQSQTKSNAQTDERPVKSAPPKDWMDVAVGTNVLAVDDPDDGWWEAKVTNAHKSGIGSNMITMLTLEWVLYPDEPSFVRRANEVAYFPASFGQTQPNEATVEGAV